MPKYPDSKDYQREKFVRDYRKWPMISGLVSMMVSAKPVPESPKPMEVE
jgi:hypothetical protein